MIPINSVLTPSRKVETSRGGKLLTVAEDIALLQSKYISMIEVQVGATDGRSGHLEDNIVGFSDVWNGTSTMRTS